jgi:putative membrane protein
MIELEPMLKALVGTLLFVVVGILVFLFAFFLIAKLTPFSIRKEIEEDQNTALAIVIGSVILGLAWIIAAAIHG